MKVTQKIFSFLVLAAAVLTGCERDYECYAGNACSNHQ